MAYVKTIEDRTSSLTDVDRNHFELKTKLGDYKCFMARISFVT